MRRPNLTGTWVCETDGQRLTLLLVSEEATGAVDGTYIFPGGVGHVGGVYHPGAVNPPQVHLEGEPMHGDAWWFAGLTPEKDSLDGVFLGSSTPVSFKLQK